MSDPNLTQRRGTTFRRPAVVGCLVLFVALCLAGTICVVVEHEPTDALSKKAPPAPAVNFDLTRAKAEQGDVAAQNLLGELYLNGRGTRPDSKIAAEWFTRSAQLGHAPAQLNLGMLFEAGQGVPVDYARAVEWYGKAAAQGNPAAQYSLAVMYVYGRGVQRDDRESIKWFALAAERGHGLSQYALAQRYIAGQGVQQDLIEAFKWLTLSAAQNISDAIPALDDIKSSMSPTQIAEGVSGRSSSFPEARPRTHRSKRVQKRPGLSRHKNAGPIPPILQHR